MPLTADLCELDRYGNLDEESLELVGCDLTTYEDKILAALIRERMPEEEEPGIRKIKPADNLVIKSIGRLGRNYEDISELRRLLTKEK